MALPNLRALVAALTLSLLGGVAQAQITIYGTTAASNAGGTYTVGTIAVSSTTRFDDGVTVTGTGRITIDGELQFNQTSGNSLTISNTIAGTGTLALISTNSGTLQLIGTSGTTRLIPLNMTINVDNGRLMGPLVSGTENGTFQLGASGTGTLNVAGGFVTGSAWQIGVGSTGVGTVNVTSGTFGPIAGLTVGGSSGGSGGTGTLTINGGVVGDNPSTPLNVGGFRFGVAQNSSGVATITSGTLRATSIATVDGATGSFIGLAGTGSVGLNSGYLQAAHLTLGAASTGRGTLTIASGSASTNNLVVGGTGNGTLTITGGAMKSGNGTLGLGSSGTGTVTVSSGTWLVNGNGLTNGEREGVLRVGGTSGGTGSLTIGNGGYVVVSSTFTTGSNGTFALNSGGTLQIGGKDGVYTPSTATGTASAVGSGTMGVLVGNLGFAGTLKFAQNDTSGTLPSSTYASNLSGSGGVVKTGTGVIILTGSNSYTGGTTLTAGFLQLGSADAIGTTGTLSFNGGAIRLTATNTTDYSPRFSTDANQQYAVDTNGQTATIATNLANVNNSFRKEGLGTLTLTGTNSFTAVSTGSNGGVLAGTPTTLATSGTATTGANSTIQMTVASGGDSWGGQLMGSGTFAKLGAGTLTLTSLATGTTAGTLVVSEGAVKGTTNNIRRDVVNNSQLTFDQTTSGTYSRAITGTGNVLLLNSGTITWTGTTSTYTGITTVAGGRLIGNTRNIPGDVVNNSAVQFTQTFSGTYAGDMSGSGSLTKTGNSTVTLTGSNSYQGGTFVNAGSLIGDTDSLQGTIVVGSGTLGFDQATSGTFSAVLSGTSATSRFVKTGAGDLTLSGSNGNDGAWTVSTGRLIGTTTSLQGSITNNAAVTFDQATTGTYAGTMSGSGTLTKTGAGTLTLTGSNSYSGGTTVSAGELIGSTTSLQGAIANSAAVTFDQATAGTYAGVMSGNGSLKKTGAGTVTLTNASTFTGATTVDAGTLAIAGSGAITSSPTITIKSGATLDVAAASSGWQLASGQTLGGDGTLAGAATALAGAIVAPGEGIGTLTATGGFTLLGTLVIEISGTAIDQLDSSSGALAIGSGTVSFTELAAPVGDLVFAKYLSLSGGAFGTVTGLPAGYSIDYAYLGNQIALVQSTPGVPEIDPAGLGSVAALVAGALGLAERRRRP